MLAAITATPELELDEGESKRLADGIARVAGFYDHKLNPKALAWVNLICVAGSVYGPRAVAISARLNAQDKPKAQPKVVVLDGGARPKPGPATGPQPRTPADLYGLDYWGYVPDAI
jgi:hypothetical protein